jgi:hypothetical protein
MKQYQKKQRAFSRIGPHPKEILELMIGNLLGDGSLEKRHNATRFVFSQEGRNQEYLHWLHKQFAAYGYCSPQKPMQHIRISKGNKVRRTLRFRTWSFISFNWLYDAFYSPAVHKPLLPDGLEDTFGLAPLKPQKRIPELLAEWLTPKVLALWFMDDGSVSGNPSTGGLKIATHCFTKRDLQYVQHILCVKFQVSSKLHRDKLHYVLAFNQYDAAQFAALILPWVHPSMQYKLRFVKKSMG